MLSNLLNQSLKFSWVSQMLNLIVDVQLVVMLIDCDYAWFSRLNAFSSSAATHVVIWTFQRAGDWSDFISLGGYVLWLSWKKPRKIFCALASDFVWSLIIILSTSKMRGCSCIMLEFIIRRHSYIWNIHFLHRLQGSLHFDLPTWQMCRFSIFGTKKPRFQIQIIGVKTLRISQVALLINISTMHIGILPSDIPSFRIDNSPLSVGTEKSIFRFERLFVLFWWILNVISTSLNIHDLGVALTVYRSKIYFFSLIVACFGSNGLYVGFDDGVVI